MKYLLIATLFLAGCSFPKCEVLYETKVDQGACWKQCVMAVAGSRWYHENLNRCLQQACNYEHKEVCK